MRMNFAHVSRYHLRGVVSYTEYLLEQCRCAGYVKNLWKHQIASDRFSKSEKGGIVQVLEYNNNNNNTGTCILSAYFFNKIVYIL